MPRNKEFNAAQQGAIIMSTDVYNELYFEVARKLGTSRQAVRQMHERVHEEADKENIHPLTACTIKQPRSERSLKLDVRDRRRLIRHAIKNRANRRKPWSQIAKKVDIEAFLIVVNHVFEIASYARHSPRYKSFLIEKNKRKRFQFCIEMLERDSKWWKKVVWIDESIVKVESRRGQVWVTRKKNEVYHFNCVNVDFPKHFDLMFWGCFSAEMRDFYHFYVGKTKNEKEVAQENLQNINVDYNVEAQIKIDEWKIENVKRSKSKQLKRLWKSKDRSKLKKKDLKGGIDWYRYRTEVFLLKLLSFCKKIIRKYGECYLLEDGVASHIAWENVIEYNISSLRRIPWPTNSLDLNMIEQAWFHIKRKVGQKAFVANIISTTVQAWGEVWEELDQELIKKWVGRMRPHMEIVKEQRDDNKYHG